ncbi:MAG: DUF166 domain-containing protein [Verrucomicrobia bacterium]|nr:DUF166 domain-containing protein [Verrucomicrobiota bacterium]
MKIVVLRSRKFKDKKIGEYHQSFDTHYADRIIGNLSNRCDFCAACEADCLHCRDKYDWRFSENVGKILDFPSVLPFVLEKPGKYVPSDMPAHDVLLVIHIHEQILLEILARCPQWGTKGVVVPLEAPGWVSGAAIRQALEICARNNIEISFPKPFCSFNPPCGGVLDEFRKSFRIGFPDVDLTVENGIIIKARVNVSAACGATYYIARWLVGRAVCEDLKTEVISRRLHSYPCTASMEWDDELGDTPLHVAGQAHYEILSTAQVGTVERARPIITPLGKVLPRPAPVSDNIRNIENAKKVIMAELEIHPQISLEQIKQKEHITPASIHSAILLLKKERKIRTMGMTIIKS